MTNPPSLRARLRATATFSLGCLAALSLSACANEYREPKPNPCSVRGAACDTLRPIERPCHLPEDCHRGYERHERVLIEHDGKDGVISVSHFRTEATTADAYLPGTTKAYAFGRYRDPLNPNVLHQPHVVLRHEEHPAWWMHAGRGNEVVVGNTASGTGRRYSLQRPPLQKSELGAELRRQRTESQLLREQSAAIGAQSQRLVGAASELTASSAAQQRATTQVYNLETRVKALETAPPPRPVLVPAATTPAPAVTPAATPAATPTRTNSGGPAKAPGINPDGTISGN